MGSKQRRRSASVDSGPEAAQATPQVGFDRGNAFAQEQLQDRSGSVGDAQKGTWQVLGQSFGSLQALHDWLVAQSQDPSSTVPHEPVLHVRLTGKVVQRQQTTWTYYSPNQRLVIDGQGATVTGRNKGRPTPGWFLSYRPTVQSTEQAPAKANFEMRGLTVRGYESGGVELSPQSAPGNANRYDGGYSAFIEGALLEGNRFEKLGSKDTPEKKTDYAKGRFGAAGVLMRGVSDSTVAGNYFEDLENGDVRGTKWGPRLIHAIYARDRSSGNTFKDNRFKDISGDSIRLSNASNDNTITGNRARNAGLRTLVSEFYNSGPSRLEQDSTGNRIFGNVRGKRYGKSKRMKRFHEKEAHN